MFAPRQDNELIVFSIADHWFNSSTMYFVLFFFSP
jgi:hypothetical protein